MTRRNDDNSQVSRLCKKKKGKTSKRKNHMPHLGQSSENAAEELSFFHNSM